MGKGQPVGCLSMSPAVSSFNQYQNALKRFKGKNSRAQCNGERGWNRGRGHIEIDMRRDMTTEELDRELDEYMKKRSDAKPMES
ncbi:unnamed protein product [Toxocara canis]|uniref:FoP_duplication domain-containing protein n=1 Tax=Toxocara canis TaxID=6265 RepID=A0A183TVR7_TOXCA|nr:unnamed protein product [Toxocara canis]